METKIHEILYNYLKDYIPVQEITHAATQICSNPTEEKVLEMVTYLDQFDKEFIPNQTVGCHSFASNQIRFAASEVNKEIKKASAETENPK